VAASAPTQLFVGGSWRPSSDGATFDVHDPATGTALATVASATAADGVAALDAAAVAQERWAETSPRVRADLLRAAFDRLVERAEDFAVLMTLEMGKPLAEARGEVAYAAEFLRWFSEETTRIHGRYQRAPAGNSRILVTKRPVGPALFITPWNFPLAMATRKIAPALAAGCTCVLKPAALTPLTALAFAALLEEVGVPGGVVNVIPSASARAVTAPLFSDRRLRKLSFTGSTEVGRALLAQSAPGVLRTSMELGGNAPFVVFEDADLDTAVQAAIVAKLRNMGEACTAANRFLVHADVAEEFATRLAEAFAGLTVGPGLAPGSQIGPLIDEGSRAAVHDLVEGATAAGAALLTGGSLPDGPGWFYPPTVLADVPAEAPILGTEIFGPVAPVVSFADEDEAVRRANASDVGLAGYVFTEDVRRVLRLADRLEVGMLGVNRGLVSDAAAPFGGVKQSGLGREGGAEGIEEYLDTVYVSIAD
jgi:succinate-semialdehyde dehydrogenase/glutarate-semialdehyde dehydrogenase